MSPVQDDVTTRGGGETPSQTCARCRNPGRCCVGFGLPFHGTREEVVARLRSVRTGLNKDGRPMILGSADVKATIGAGYSHVLEGLPFEPFFQSTMVGKDGQRQWLFWCPKLSRDGKCTIYADRPAVCVEYRPKSDRLCAEYEKPIGDEPSSAAFSKL